MNLLYAIKIVRVRLRLSVYFRMIIDSLSVGPKAEDDIGKILSGLLKVCQKTGIWFAYSAQEKEIVRVNERFI